MYIFGYGSLVNIKSAQKSFKRELQQEDFIPVVVNGYKKVWNAIEYIIFEKEEKVTNGIFLNLEKGSTLSTCSTCGTLLKITQEEFNFLKLREKNYSCIEIESISGFETNEKIYTFMTTNKEKLANKYSKNCFIPKNYIKLLEEGLKPYSNEFKEEFIKSYSSFPFSIKEGTYTFSDPIQNKFAKDGIKDEQ